ncbi:hypothetical protein ACQ4PT_004106 [Festuca glaucescens]
MGEASDVESVDNSNEKKGNSKVNKDGDKTLKKATQTATSGASGANVMAHRNIPVQYPQLTDTNYGVWAVKMKIILRQLRVWHAITDDEVDDEVDEGAMAVIAQSVPDSVPMTLAEFETAREAWEALKEMRATSDSEVGFERGKNVDRQHESEKGMGSKIGGSPSREESHGTDDNDIYDNGDDYGYGEGDDDGYGDGYGKDVQISGDMPNHGDRGDHDRHDVDTDDDDADTGEDLGSEGAHDGVHDDHAHQEAQSDDDYHGHDNYADGTDADDPVPSMPLYSNALTPTQFVYPPSQATTDSSGPRHYKTLKKVYKDTKPVMLEYSGLCLLGVEEPANFVEASKVPSWKHAMDEELKAIESNGTWTLVTQPPNHKPIGLKWVYKLKKDTQGAVVKHKARLVAKGYVQRQGVDYEEVFAPVARLETVRLLLALAAQEDWKVHHMDVKSTFLNSDLTEEVYVEQPIGYEKKGEEEKVYKLKKALYGLKQAPRAWNSKLDQCLVSLGFKRCPLEHAVYTKSSKDSNLLVGVYVDDLIITGDNTQEIEGFKAQMKKKFSMSDLGLLSYYLGIEVKQNSGEISLCQSAYAVKLLDKCGMADCNVVQVPMDQRHKLSKISSNPPVDTTTYRSIVGSLRYLVHTRPDLAYSVGIVSRFMENPTTEHMSAIKQILRYVKGTINLGCTYKNRKERLVLHGYSDSDMAGDVDDRKSTSGMVFYLGPNPISWNSQKQKVVALSSCEAEYIAASTAACQGVWLRRLLADLAKKEVQKVSLKIDNQAAISLCKNPVHHERSKHIDTRFACLLTLASHVIACILV